MLPTYSKYSTTGKLYSLFSSPSVSASPAINPFSDYAYAIPGGMTFNQTITADKSYKLDIRVVGKNQAFTGVQIGLLNNSSSYTLKRLYVGQTNQNNENEFSAVVTSDTTIEAGTDNEPSVTWLNPVSISPSNANAVRVVLQIGSGAPLQTWGDWPDYQAPGWIATYQEELSQNITAGWNLAGGNAFGMLPCIVVKFTGLASNVVALPFIGDSHTYGNGDSNQPYRPYAVAGRLERRFYNAGNVSIAPINLGRGGYTTTQFNLRLAKLLSQFDIRAVALQYGSINNVAQSLPYSTIRNDWTTAEGIVGNRKLIPYFGAGANSIVNDPPDWWNQFRAEQTWLESRIPSVIDAVFNQVTNISTGAYYSSQFYDDGAHPNATGYTNWESDFVGQLTAIVGGW